MSALLLVLTASAPAEAHQFVSIDAIAHLGASEKARALREGAIAPLGQSRQRQNPDHRIVLEEIDTTHGYLSTHAEAYWGQGTGDFARFGIFYWELPVITPAWDRVQSTVADTAEFGGRHFLVFWQQGRGDLVALAEELRARLKNIHLRGAEAWGRKGVAVTLMQHLPVTLYGGQIFDGNCAAVVPKHEEDLPALWAFLSSPSFATEVRKLDRKMNVTNATLLKVPFDLAHWQQVAAEKYPNGLPEPSSNDPTQWLFKGNPVGSTDPLQVAVARLLGYRWPDQVTDDLDAYADTDGIVCVPAVARELPAAERLRKLLVAAWGDAWTNAALDKLLADVGYAGKSLDAWLRDGFFPAHNKRFDNRPFIWHIWDGHPAGFSALVNYHRLDRATLRKLTFTYLGDWIAAQKAAVEHQEAGAEGRYAAALALQGKLKAIEEGAPPFDIYVRWKPMHQQPIGWEPDINDGVRLNVRPFVNAGVLRSKFTVSWNKDRGANPDGSERFNDLHPSIEERRAARAAHGTR